MSLLLSISFLKKNKKASHGKSNTSLKTGVAESPKNELVLMICILIISLIMLIYATNS